MNAKILLRVASIIILLHIFGHMYGHLTWRQTTNPVKQIVIDQMTQHKFPFMGAVKSLGDYYDGYGYAAALALLFISYLFWIVSNTTEKQKDLVLKILPAISVFLFAWGIDELFFFFPFAALFTLVASVFSAMAFFAIQKHS